MTLAIKKPVITMVLQFQESVILIRVKTAGNVKIKKREFSTSAAAACRT